MEGCWAIDVTKRFWIFLPAGLAVVGVLLFILLSTTTGAHLRLEGKILKVRVLPVNAGLASIVVVDFRATNPSDVPFVVSSVKIQLEPPSGDALEGTQASKPDLQDIFQYAKIIGPKYNDVLSLQDRVAPHQTVDRMTGARFEIPEAAVNSRKGIRLQIEDLDGAAAELGESK
jgi:hypothetical protein